MISQLLNIICDYSTSIGEINIEYHDKYEYCFADDITQFIECIACKPSNKAYNYRSMMYPNIHNKNLWYVADLPRNYV